MQSEDAVLRATSKVQHSERDGLRCFNREFYAPTYTVSGKGEEKCVVLITKEETFWKNNRYILEDVPVTYVKFIITVIAVSVKKGGSGAYVPPLVLQSVIRTVLHFRISECLYFSQNL